MASLVFENVEKVFPGGTKALVGVNLHVEDGELIVLVGPSGCGKSTLLRIVAGLDVPTRGTIRIDDRVANDLSPRDRNVAMVFQDYALYPHMTVRENLEFPLKMRGQSREDREKRIAWAAEVLELGSLLDRRPRQLSGGQQQRVAMGRALVREPSVFLLDEPLSNLDAKLRVEVRAEIAELQRRMKTTMLYVTHDQTEAMTLGDRVAVLRAGRVLQVAPPRELYDRPAEAFVAGFIGNPPMNLFPAKLEASGGDRSLVFAGRKLSLDGRLAESSALEPGEVTAGIRPEAFVLADEANDDAIPGRVEHVEWLGHETLAHVHVGSSEEAVRLVARLPGMQALERGQEIALAVAERSVHLFPAERDEAKALP
ncbi:MAG: sn-glycerol-3-phosphate ABC transporter ATP-binding protein UgpC [Deltaproteobacteria bacterium]|nr:sn-glycerol-3-phosphate ABC transporter ATP-binding protein UgpC [Deltaproteobacteria bacterium]